MLMSATKSSFLCHWFLVYTRRLLRHSFHTIHLYGSPPTFQAEESIPLLVCLNHSSWWDVLLGIWVEAELFGWEAYTVMDAQQLQRYQFFNRLGVIGVDRSSLRGAKEFLDYAEHLLRNRHRSLWITAQGEMISNYSRPIHFQPGIGSLARALGDFYLARVAFHYEFWNERLPEAFVSVSPVERIHIDTASFNRRAFVHGQEQALEVQLSQLLACASAREVATFTPILTGASGINPIYDSMRAVSARLKGETYTPDHGHIATPRWRERAKTRRPPSDA